jgi:hypothetical protein
MFIPSQINFLYEFEIRAAAKGDVRFLLGLDVLRSNVRIERQAWAEEKRALDRNRAFESSVEQAFLGLPTDNPAYPVNEVS